MAAMIPEPTAIVEQRVSGDREMNRLARTLRINLPAWHGHTCALPHSDITGAIVKVEALPGLILYRQFFATLGAKHNLDTSL